MTKLLYLLLLIPAIAFGQVPTQGLVGQWRFNDNADDETGNWNTAIVNGTLKTKDRFNAMNKALLFNGVTDKIDFGTNTELNLTEEITVSVWVNLTDIPTGEDRVISKGDDQYVIYFQDNTVPVVRIKGSPDKILSFGSALNLNEWYNLSITYNSAETGNNFKAYINGDLAAQKSASGAIPVDNGNLTLGNKWNSSLYGFKGGIDDVRIFKRALPEAEIKQFLAPSVLLPPSTPPDSSPSTQPYLLYVRGRILAEGVKVQLSSNWPDYVFSDEYDLMPLNELKDYIHTNNHLPQIPPAAEAEAQGIDLGEINTKLLQKIEELTLYQIQLLEMLEEQNRRIKLLEEKVETAP